MLYFLKLYNNVFLSKSIFLLKEFDLILFTTFGSPHNLVGCSETIILHNRVGR